MTPSIEIDESVFADEGLAEGERSFMLRASAAAGAQVRESAALAAETSLSHLGDEGRPRAVVVAGVGPAARAGDVLAAVAGPRCPVPVVAHRSVGVPGWVGAADVVLAVSASGKGPEALAAAEAAVARGARLVAIGAPDTPLQSYAEQAHAPFVAVPRRWPARVSFWALVVPVLLAARALRLLQVTEADLAETASRLDADAERCRPAADAFVNPAKALALELAGTIPLVWGSSPLATVAASRMADQLAANARYPAIAGEVVEAGRGRVGVLDGVYGGLAEAERDFFADRIEQPDPTRTRLRVVLLRDDGGQSATEPPDSPRVTDPEMTSDAFAGAFGDPVEARRANAISDVAGARGVAVSTVEAHGASSLERFASLVAVPDFATVYLALAHGLDPLAIPAVTELKERITP